MLFFESREIVDELARLHLPPVTASALMERALPAIGFKKTDHEADCWLFGDASLPEDMPWPEVDGRSLVHSARLRLDGLPRVIADQPTSGHLSFFDGYPWAEATNSHPADYACVVHDDGTAVVPRPCPLAPSNIDSFIPKRQQFVAPVGPYWTIPSSYGGAVELPTSVDSDGVDLLAFSAALAASAVSDKGIVAQLFGNPPAVQHDPTPQPRFSAGGSSDAWLHLATIDDRDVFAYYFATQHRDLASLEFSNLVFSAQCD